MPEAEVAITYEIHGAFGDVLMCLPDSCTLENLGITITIVRNVCRGFWVTIG